MDNLHSTVGERAAVRPKGIRILGPTIFLVSAGASLIACVEPTSVEDGSPPVITETGGAATGGGTAGPGTGTAGGTGQEPEQCLFDQPEPAVLTGKKYQCEGSLEVTFGADGFPPQPTAVSFGNSIEDPYDAPLVMACCREYLLGQPACAQPHIQACFVDAVQQFCASLPRNLWAQAEAIGGIAGNELTALGNFIAKAERQTECMSVFLEDTGVATTSPTCDPNVPNYSELVQDARWDLPNSNDWVDITNPFVRIDFLEVLDLYPTNNEEPPVGCKGFRENDDQVFSMAPPFAPDITALLREGEAILEGLLADGTLVHARASLGGTALGCTECSVLELGKDARGRIDVQRLVLRATNLPSAVPGGPGGLAEHVTLRLIQPFVGRFHHRGRHMRIPPGRAVFVASALSEHVNASVMLHNATPIDVWLLPRRGVAMSGFEVRYRDAQGQTWRLDISETLWR